MNISVAMAVYNGGKYLREQLDSILKQLDEMDELIISYNDSTDDTLKILEEYVYKYEFIIGKKKVLSQTLKMLLHIVQMLIFSYLIKMMSGLMIK